MVVSHYVAFDRVVSRGEAILALLFCVEGILPSNHGQDARDTQGRDALATRRAIGKLRSPLPPIERQYA